MKDYEAELYKQGYATKQLAKKKIKDNARQAECLRLQLSSLEGELTSTTNETQKDSFLEDVGFLHNLIVLTIDRCGDNEKKRARVIKYISAIKTELDIL